MCRFPAVVMNLYLMDFFSSYLTASRLMPCLGHRSLGNIFWDEFEAHDFVFGHLLQQTYCMAASLTLTYKALTGGIGDGNRLFFDIHLKLKVGLL